MQNHEIDFFKEYTVSTPIGSYNNRKTNSNQYLKFKRFLDISLSLIGLILTLPVIILFALIIKIETPGPAFFIQERVGLNGKYFNLIKLRSMGIDAEQGGAKWAEKNDPRVTRTGAFIRKVRIDELPQLWNVFIGDMSLIGPRPERPIFTAKFNEEIPGFVARLEVKPGLTGWAQINGGYDITPKEKLILDKFYIENLGFMIDVKIFIKTFHVCLTGTGAR
jgi:lipopolysaccharide/colanic/teichoic acid biosynthesis glycosyltransferase